jgi:beta-galactosidase
MHALTNHQNLAARTYKTFDADDGGGIYRHVTFTAVQTPGPVIAPWGVYAGGSNATGPITWDAAGNPSADSSLMPSIEVWNNASTSSSFALTVSIVDAAGNGNVVATASGSGTVAGGGGVVIWEPSAAMLMPAARLWHVATGVTPALYTFVTQLSVGGAVVDTVNVTFGVRATFWHADTGFWLNGKPFKILGNANHQDFAAVGVAVPDHLQWHRVQKQKDYGSNGWRTAHNPPTPALLDACDELGFVVWDENHRNAQYDQVPMLIKRDRNHPSVVIWSICNEVLCNTGSAADAKAMANLMHSLDPYSGRPVSANQNGYIGPDTPLDVQGFDYATTNYDHWHAQAPLIPSISSETSSAVSDRGEYANDAAGGHVTGYDNQYPGWGESAEQAWGGVDETNVQGILTRPFISGGWTWTGWDYRGEPTPYGEWPQTSNRTPARRTHTLTVNRNPTSCLLTRTN